jgi:AbiV family abortive infection protein
MAIDNFHIEGYKYSLINSKGLLKMADKSADENEYGIACSLNILSAEEAVKGIAIILNVNGLAADFNKMFKDHKTKHKHLFELSLMNYLQIERMVLKFNIRDTVAQINSLPEDVRNTVIEKFPKFYSNSI